MLPCDASFPLKSLLVFSTSTSDRRGSHASASARLRGELQTAVRYVTRCLFKWPDFLPGLLLRARDAAGTSIVERYKMEHHLMLRYI